MNSEQSSKMPDNDLKNAKHHEKETELDPALAAHLSDIAKKIDHTAKYSKKKHDEANPIIEDQKKEIAELKESLLRLAADKENAIKRMERQITDASKYAISSFLKDLLPAIDNLYRASQSIPTTGLNESPELKIIYDGIELTKNDFINIFAKHGLVRIEPQAGDDFDHNFHQAVATVDGPDIENGKIVNVMQAGYELSGRLVRAAMVTVCKR